MHDYSRIKQKWRQGRMQDFDLGGVNRGSKGRVYEARRYLMLQDSLSEGNQPPPHQLGLGQYVSSPCSRVRGGAPAAKWFYHIISTQDAFSVS